MSFSLIAAGRPEDVRKQLDAQLEHHKQWGPNPQEAAVVALIEQHLAATDFPGGVYVDAAGHQDPGQASLTITLRPLQMPIVELDAPAEG